MDEKPNFEDFLEIINSDEFQAYQEEYRHINSHQNSWNYKHPEALKKAREKYEQTEKGMQTRKRVNKNRRLRMVEAQADLDYDEKMLIRDFYINCPDGYEVDHIVPISRGGKHCLSNLQYLTPNENKKKAYRLFYKNRNSSKN